MTDRNDLAYWFPILSAVPGIKVPRTQVITTDADLSRLLDGDVPDGFDRLVSDIRAAAESFGYPVFLRTGHTSGKHDWCRTCFVPGPADVPAHIFALVEFSAMADMVGLPTGTWAVREFLTLDAPFTAFRGMPIAREFRCFFRDGKCLCIHPYYPIDSIRGASDPDWERTLRRMSTLKLDDQIDMCDRVNSVAKAFDGAWSVDFAQAESGEWVCIDMAEAARSFHWPGCGHAAE